MWVCGEVLVDLIPQPGSAERVGVIGGGPENTAKALARLGHQVEFIDGISTDKWGVAAKKELDLDGVGTRFVKFSDKPDRKSTRLNSSHIPLSRMPSSA